MTSSPNISSFLMPIEACSWTSFHSPSSLYGPRLGEIDGRDYDPSENYVCDRPSDHVNSPKRLGSTTAFVETGEAKVYPANRGSLLPDAPYRCSHPLP